jgi:hypothetical protein
LEHLIVKTLIVKLTRIKMVEIKNLARQKYWKSKRRYKLNI